MTAPMDITGPAAPPRANGELVFASRGRAAFGMAVALYEAGVFTWPQFQAALTLRIAYWQAAPIDGANWNYYHHWLGALEDVLAGCGAVAFDGVTVRAKALAQRPDGYDHGH